MSNPNKMFKAQQLEPSHGRLEFALEGSEDNMYLDIEISADGRIKLRDPGTGIVILRYESMADLENFISKTGLGGGEEGDYL